MLFAFGPFELDLATCELRRDGEGIRLQPRVFGILRYLIEHRDRVVGKQELIDALWGGYRLNAVAVPWTINRARKALGDQPNESGFIETVRGHGYRFVGELETRDEPALVRRDRSSAPPGARTEPQRGFAERPFVGRSQVIAQLTAALEAAVEGHGRLCLLTGEAGIGKTRCAEEFALLARRRGLQVWVGRCFQHGIAPAFWPFVQLLRAACGDSSAHDSVRAEGDALLREIEQRGGDPARASAQANSDDDRFWLLDRLSRWLVRSARSQVRVIMLDDVHCADENSLQALSLLTPMLAQARLLVIATVRDSGSGASARSAAVLASRLRPCEHLPLLGLRSEDIATYLSAVFGDELASQLSAALAAKTAGNPLFLNEVTRVVGAQYEREGRVRVEDVRLPAAVTEIISARLHELDPRTRALLDAACVIGEEFSIAVLQRATSLPSSEVLAGLQEAADVDIVEPRPDGAKHAFVHPLMREVLYGALSSAQRAKLHAAVGLALEALGVIAPALNELAYHFHLAPLDQYYERAARYGRLAGDAAMRALAYEAAVQCYGWALEAQTQGAPYDVRAACELLLVSAPALGLTGHAVETVKNCRRAIELAREARLPDILVRAARQLRPSVWIAHIPDPIAAQALEEALRLLPESELELRARAYAQLATLPPYSLRLESSAQMSAEGMRLARQTEDHALLLETQSARLFALCGPTTIEEQLDVAAEMLRHDVKYSSRWASDAHFARYHALMQRGDRSAVAERALDAYARHAGELRLRFSTWHCERLRAQRLLHAGKLDRAERRFEELWNDAQALRLPYAAIYYRAQRFTLSRERTGKLPAAAGDQPEPAAWIAALPGFRVQRVAMALEIGDSARATREFQALARDGFAAVSGDPFALYASITLAKAAIALDDHEAALALRALIEPHASSIALSVFTLSSGSVCRYLGLLEQLLGRRAEARAYFERAIETDARVGHELERLRATLDLAALLTQGRAGERSQARKLAGQVASIAEDLGALALSARARAVEADVVPSQVRPLPAAPAKATRRSSRPAKAPRGRM
jgi:DNA-binding winged helix-turn-helix (wHTH) protein/tetratricopeptide (TPR) repeat protein